MNQQTLIITPNQRLSAYVKQQYYQQQFTDQPLGVVEEAPIFALSTWCAHFWQQLQLSDADLPHILSEHQAHYIWRHIIKQAQSDNPLMDVVSTATQALKTWQLLTQWQIDLEQPEIQSLFQYSEDARQFYQWLMQFLNYCDQHKLIDSAALLQQITLYYIDKLDAQKIIFTGFDEFAPNLKRFIEACQQRGICIEHTHFSAQTQQRIASSPAQSLSFSTQKQQLSEVVALIKHKIIAGETHLAIVAPDLDSIRSPMLNTLQEHFADASAYAISGGMPLSAYPIIHTALNLLTLTQTHCEFTTLSHILRTPFMGEAEEEAAARALLLARISQLNAERISLETVCVFAQQTLQPYYCPELLKRLSTLKKPRLKTPQNLAYWAEIFAQILLALGWPGQRNVNSQEYQAIQRWQALLAELASLSHVHEPVNFNSALQEINYLTQNTLFQPESQKQPKFHIMGLLEAAGLPFTTVYILDLHHENWPASAKVNPFIPLVIQRQFNMPHCSPERELQFSQRMMQRFMQSNQHLFFCYFQQDKGQEFFISPLLKKFPSTAFPLTPRHLGKAALQLETYSEVNIPIRPQEAIRGGSAILKDQAACPFKAFARFRLDAQPLELPQTGLSARARGTVLHYALENFWRHTESQQQLLAYEASELHSQLDSCISTALQRLQKDYASTIENTLLELEAIRLHKLLERWLELEKQRPPFRVIAIESANTLELSGLKLHLRVDRIDGLADGTHLVIDYKTAVSRIQECADERMRQPQLPLYALTDPQISDIGFAQLRAGDSKLMLLGDADYEWAELRAQWQQQLSQLAHDFMRGQAAVHPRDEQSCKHCHLHSLCRIHSAEVTS